jgi:hypothetical protein
MWRSRGKNKLRHLRNEGDDAGLEVTAIVPSMSPYVGKELTNTAIERLFKIVQF